jgi:hypothetical protein
MWRSVITGLSALSGRSAKSKKSFLSAQSATETYIRQQLTKTGIAGG